MHDETHGGCVLAVVCLIAGLLVIHVHQSCIRDRGAREDEPLQLRQLRHVHQTCIRYSRGAQIEIPQLR